MTDHIKSFTHTCKGIRSHQRAIARFLLKYPEWSSYNTDRDTVECLCGLVNLGIANYNEYGQMRLMSHRKAVRFLG